MLTFMHALCSPVSCDEDIFHPSWVPAQEKIPSEEKTPAQLSTGSNSRHENVKREEAFFREFTNVRIPSSELLERSAENENWRE